MKKLLSAFVLMVLVWGCAKKITPSSSETMSNSPNTNTQTAPAESNAARSAETAMAAGTLAENVAVKTVTAAEEAAITAGKNTYNAKCGRCHGLKPVGDFTAQRWIGILESMAPRAQLSDTEEQNVYTYVKANAKK